jgi:tRNA G18 (ribose-2'-O)-methylase SpoU
MIIPVETLDDPRIAPYRNVKDRDLAADGNRFLAESEQVVRRLLMSSLTVESVLLAQRRQEEISPILPAQVPVYVVSDGLMKQILGFKFHSGVMACGVRPPPLGVAPLLGRLGTPATLMILPEIANTENLGALMRIAAGFGIDGLILGPRSCDPFYRQAVRVSMGAVFSLCIVQSTDLREDLARLRAAGVELIATVLDPSAEPLPAARRADRMGLLFGNEAQGLAPEVIEQCHRRVTIPMNLGTDSLNVAIAAAVCCYHFQHNVGR